MKKDRKHLLNKKGEGYIDTVVLVLCAMLVIALAVRVYPVYIVKLQLDNFADELVREAEIAGRVGSETSDRERVLNEKNGAIPLCIMVKNREYPAERRGNGNTHIREEYRAVWRLRFISGPSESKGKWEK